MTNCATFTCVRLGNKPRDNQANKSQDTRAGHDGSVTTDHEKKFSLLSKPTVCAWRAPTQNVLTCREHAADMEGLVLTVNAFSQLR